MVFDHDKRDCDDVVDLVFEHEVSLLSNNQKDSEGNGDSNNFNSSFRSGNTSGSSFTRTLLDEAGGMMSGEAAHQQRQQESLTSSFRSNGDGSLDSTFSKLFDEDYDDQVVQAESEPRQTNNNNNGTETLSSSFRSNGSLDSSLSKLLDKGDQQDHGASSNSGVIRHQSEDSMMNDDSFSKLFNDEADGCQQPSNKTDRIKRRENGIANRQGEGQDDNTRGRQDLQIGMKEDLQTEVLNKRDSQASSRSSSRSKLFKNDTDTTDKDTGPKYQSEDSMVHDDSFSNIFGDEDTDGCQQPSNKSERGLYLEELMMCETTPSSEGVGPALLTEGQTPAEPILASDLLMKKGENTGDLTKSQTAKSPEFLCAPGANQMPGEVQVTIDKGVGSPDQQQASFESVSTSPPTLASEAQQGRSREDHPTPVDKTLRMSFVSSDDDESDNYRSCNTSPDSEQDDGRQNKLETVSETPKEVGGSKINQRAATSKKLPTYTQVFSDILQGFLKGDHYIEDDVVDTTVSDATSLQSISPVPLAPHVELRHSRAKINSILPTPKVSNKTHEVATDPPKLCLSTTSSSPLLTSEDEKDILQGFLKGDHYIEDDDVGTTVSDATSLQYISPVPLAPHVELRHSRAKFNSTPPTPKVSNKTNEFATEPSPELCLTEPSTTSCSPVSTSEEESMPNNDDKAAVPKASRVNNETPQANNGNGFIAQFQGGAIQNSTSIPGTNAAVGQKSDTLPPKEPQGASNRGTKRKEQQEQTTPSSSSSSSNDGATQIIGMGFFSQLQENGLFDSVVGTTEKKKRKKVSRKRKPKTDLLEGISMGFFSSQMADEQKQQHEQQKVEDNNKKAIKPQEISERIKPAYSWAPTVDERTRTVMEFSLPLVLPAVAKLSNFTSFAWIYCFTLPFVHTFETLLTNFGPKASNLHFKFAPINPMWHMCIDLMLLHPMCILAFVCPEAYGPNAHVYGVILFFLEYIYWAVAYKDIVLRREEAAKAKMKSI